MDQITIQADNYSAEYGRSAGGQIQLTSRGGTNAYHGSAFDYLRNDFFDAWNSYSKFVNQTRNAGIKKPALRMNEFGGTLGGPIRIPWLYNGKDKSFFFVSYEGLRLDSPGSGIFQTLTAADRTHGNSVVNSYLAFAAPQGTGTTGLPLTDQYGVAAYARSYQNLLATNSTSVRFDQKIRERTNVFLRVAYSPSDSSARSSTHIGEQDTTQQYNYTFTAGVSQIFSPNTVNQFRANYTRAGGHNISTLSAFGGATAPTSEQYTQMFPSQYGASPVNSLFSFGDYAEPDGLFSFQVGSAAQNVQRQINLIDGFTWLKGRHNLKMGVDWRMLFPTAAPTVYSQTVAYYGAAKLASGAADIDVAQSQDIITVHQQDVALYVQDNWHATTNLTVNAGLRWDVDPAPYGTGNKPLYTVSTSTANNPSNIVLNPAGTALYPTKYNQFQPRVGVSYVAGRQAGFETLIKAGFGSFYSPASGTGMTATNFWPYNRGTVNLGQVWYTNPASPVGINPALPYQNQNLLGYSPSFVTPRTFEWNASVQQNLGGHRTFTLAYVGAAGRKLSRATTISGAAYKYAFSTLSAYYPVDTSDYNSLQASYVQQFGSGLSLLANYTWAHSYDTASSDYLASQVYQTPSVDSQRGPSDFDQRNAANIALDWAIPKMHTERFLSALVNGWGISSIFQAHSGNPLTVRVTDYLSSANTVSVRPDMVDGVPTYLYSSQYFGGRILNRAAFSTAFLNNSSRTVGTEPRGYLRDRGFDELDFSIRRNFAITEHANLQYRCEAYNLLNQTAYSVPNTLLGYNYSQTGSFTRNSQFGGVTSTYNTTKGGTSSTFGVGGPRSLEMALRLNF